MLVFLFWNLRRRDMSVSLARLAVAHGIDFLILAEPPTDGTFQAALLTALNTGDTPRPFQHSPDLCGRIEIYSRFPPEYLPAVRESSYYSIRRMALPDRREFLLAAAHLISKREFAAESQYDEAVHFCQRIREAEGDAGHLRTIVVGDLNMNPFEYGMISALRFHAVSSKEIARQQVRTVQGIEYPYFYNPMWRFFGDRAEHPPGTYYYRKAEHQCYFWNIYDQVLVRPALLPDWNDADISVLSGDGVVPFLSARGRVPGGAGGSDHLPILFRLRV
jgi:hypothetical protein